jgi:hypothetical protein
MLTLVLMLLAVDPVECDGGKVCSQGGFYSEAQSVHGAGTPDFGCGNRDLLEDGGWGPQSKYCLFETQMTESHDSLHADLTIGAKYARSAGFRLGIQNTYWGSGAYIFNVSWRGDVWAMGNFYSTGNGGGFRNEGAYVAVYGSSYDAKAVPDVVVGPLSSHLNGGWGFGVWSGYAYTLRSRDDGAISIGGVTLKLRNTGDAIFFDVEQADGGVRTATLVYQ